MLLFSNFLFYFILFRAGYGGSGGGGRYAAGYGGGGGGGRPNPGPAPQQMGYGQYPQIQGGGVPYYGGPVPVPVPGPAAGGYAPYGSAGAGPGQPSAMGYGGAAAYGQPGPQQGLPPQLEGDVGKGELLFANIITIQFLLYESFFQHYNCSVHYAVGTSINGV